MRARLLPMSLLVFFLFGLERTPSSAFLRSSEHHHLFRAKLNNLTCHSRTTMSKHNCSEMHVKSSLMSSSPSQLQLPQSSRHPLAACIIDHPYYNTIGALLPWCFLTLVIVTNIFQAGLCIEVQHKSEDPQTSSICMC